MSASTPSPAILVVIPTLNEAGTIDDVLDALMRELPRGRSVRFAVVDGGSSDGTPERVRTRAAARPELHLLHNRQRLHGAAVNLAVRVLGDDADILVRCDARAGYPAGYVTRLVESLERNGADAVVVPTDSIGDSCLQRAIAWVCDTPLGSGGSAHRGGRRSGFVEHGHHAAFRMASFRRAGGYDPTFSHNEDAELDCRQRALGSRIYLDAQLRIGYHPPASLAALWRQYFRDGHGRSRTVQKHPESLLLRQLAVPTHVALAFLALALAPLWPPLLGYPAAYLVALAGIGIGVALRHRSLCGLWAGPAAFVMHVAWALGFVTGLATRRERRWQAGVAEAVLFDSPHERG